MSTPAPRAWTHGERWFGLNNAPSTPRESTVVRDIKYNGAAMIDKIRGIHIALDSEHRHDAERAKDAALQHVTDAVNNAIHLTQWSFASQPSQK